MNPKEENRTATNKPSREAMQLAYEYIIANILPRIIADKTVQANENYKK